MNKEEKRALLNLCYDSEKRILKQFGYFYNDHIKNDKKPEDLEDVNKSEVKRIVDILCKHPIRPHRKKRLKYKDALKNAVYKEGKGISSDLIVLCSKGVYYLGCSYSLKHVFEKFLPPPSYCANGDFIAACLDVGFIVIPIPESPNAEIYISHVPTVKNEQRYCVTIF
jgi:hypothetical protein